jgi:hypothetical protein
MVRLLSAPLAGCIASSAIVQILKCKKLYHGEFGLINRTFGAERLPRITDRQVARLLFQPAANQISSSDRAARKLTEPDRAAAIKTPFFRWKQACVTWLTFFRWQRGYVVNV